MHVSLAPQNLIMLIISSVSISTKVPLFVHSHKVEYESEINVFIFVPPLDNSIIENMDYQSFIVTHAND